MTTAVVVYGMVSPVASRSTDPTTPLRPSAVTRATPATTGGSTSGTATAARTMLRPGNSTRASSQARGVPRSRQATTVAADATPVIRRASRTAGVASSSRKLPHGVSSTSVTSGTTSSAAASAPGTSSTRGARPSVRGARSVMGASACRGAAETGVGEHLLAVRRGHQVDELLGQPGLLGLLEGRDRVGGRLVLRLRDLDGPDLVTRGHGVGGVDEPGVGLVAGHLGQDGLHVDLEAGRLGGHVVVLDQRGRDLAAGRRLHARDPGDVAAVDVRECRDPGRVGLRGHQHHGVRREDLGVAGERVVRAVHGGGVGGGQHVGGRAVEGLLGQGGGRVERQPDLDAGVVLLEPVRQVGEGPCQRRGGQHRDRGGVAAPTAAVVATAGGERGDRGHQGQSEGKLLHGRSTTTLVDLTEAIAVTPGSRPSSSAASELISETIRYGPQIISTCAITVSLVTLVTMPVSRLRALTAEARVRSRSGCSAIDSASAASSGPGTTVRPSSARVVTRPASIQRRRVSSLTPSSSAASAIR